MGDADLEILWENSTRTREVIPTKYLYPIAPEYPAGVSAQGTGVNALYFNSSEPSTTSNLGGIPQRIDFEWEGGNPAYGSLPNDNWSARFTGKLEAPYSEEFNLISRADGGSRVWVRDPNTNTWYKIIDNWTDSNSSIDTSGVIPFSLEAGVKYDFQVEYKEEVGEAQMKLLWESPSQSLAVIPQEFLYPEQLTIPVGVEGKGEGLRGEYFNNADLTDAVLSRVDGSVDFAWETGSPDASIDPDTYSARWTGQIEPLYDEDYTFSTQSDDGVRLWVNGELLIDNWDNGNEERISAPISLQGGEKYDIRMEYFEETGLASAKLLWSSLSQNKDVIPSSQLYPPKESILGVTWTGTVEAEYDEVYTFDINAAEPVRVWVDGQLVIDGTNLPLGGNVAQSGSLLLSAGHSYQVKVEYSDNDEEVGGDGLVSIGVVLLKRLLLYCGLSMMIMLMIAVVVHPIMNLTEVGWKAFIMSCQREEFSLLKEIAKHFSYIFHLLVCTLYIMSTKTLFKLKLHCKLKVHCPSLWKRPKYRTKIGESQEKHQTGGRDW